MRLIILFGAVLAALLVPAGPADAHSAGDSALMLTSASDQVTGELHIPVDQLRLATKIDAEAGLHASQAAAVRTYLTDRLAARGSVGPWRTEFGVPKSSRVDGRPHVTVSVALIPVDGDAATTFRLDGDPIVREVRTHAVQVYEGSRLIGTLDWAATSVTVTTEGSGGFVSTVWAGATHVLSGLDHLLFVAMLLLPAPLVAQVGRWRTRHNARSSVRGTVKVVTAFTLGHSVTLAAVTLTGIDVASRWLEVVIALSVGMSAVHAIRPLVRGGEVWLAGGFGLVHGMAFAGLLREVAGEPSPVVLLAFNLGVELAQLLVVALTLPSLLILAAGPHYRAVRLALGSFGLASALAWAAERATGLRHPLRPVFDALTAHPYLFALALAAMATAELVTRRRRSEIAASNSIGETA